MTLRQRIEPIRSRKLLDSAKGQPCTLEFVGVCNHDPETTVSCHIGDDQFGGMRKADDSSTVHGCSACHMFLDHGWVGKISETVRLRHVLRALQRTMRNRIERGFMVVALDPERLANDRPTKPRKPPEHRAKIAGRTEIHSRGFDKSHSRKMDGSVVVREAKP